MTLTRFAMIIIGPGYDPAVHRTSLSSNAQFSSTIVCVCNLEQAISTATELVRDNVQLIELCGGFTPEQTSYLHRAIDEAVPVGVVRYSVKEQEHLSQLFNGEAPDSSFGSDAYGAVPLKR